MVSVIIPVYNAERTLQRCIDSILAADTAHNIEIILVNDGSTDSSDKICSEYATHYSNIHYMFQSNLGVSVARNCGIKSANGEWIHFVDSDDWVEPNIYNCIDDAESYPKVDFIMFQYDTGEKTKLIDQNAEVLTNNKILCKVLKDKQYGGYCWNKLFKKEIINKYNIQFDKHIKLAEDQLFQIQYLQYVRFGYVVPKKLYHYSIINGGTYYNLEKTFSSVKAYEQIISMDFVKREDEALCEAQIHYVSNCIKTIVRLIQRRKLKQTHEYKKRFKPYIEKYLKSEKPLKINKIVAILIYFCPII